METCGAEEPYEGNLHVRFCGGIGRVIADPTRTPDCLQPALVPRFGFRQQVSASVRLDMKAADSVDSQDFREGRKICHLIQFHGD